MDATNGNGGASKYITLVSKDGFEFVVLREASLCSDYIRGMLRNNMTEARTGRCELQDINGVILEKVVEYFHYWYKYKDREDVPDMEIPVENCLELVVAADYLGMDSKPH
ncbi:BTB/POZ protein [Copromyces sp. CBS 386.78]|uniref:Elongin-C n=2 Tax=Sordaria macrospora TaxID=5147 RepID=F7WA02_SORMK|nr:uncharacterized protein SMAC_08280 [Sordaria macrospora k-hell]KAA8631262.1 hypothetical protein SMACR_08280 [Sordaria macrospora]KAH7635834.1 BTB/POZ protein [Sordaria sp. MPI-SDFR-AT-0083]KAK1776318.1 BTB/POZ protein [Copromyces sp. CBS 386.78]WPJ64309.1 hypothetical protein SMAC4_08280 [Sordaria macrospora]CCC05269.1 unnamed protein product [Sordaria macrospora k-hell]